MTTCPDGYEGINSVCVQCELGTYSYFNKCYSYCPNFYFQNDEIRACVLPGGYPLNMTVSVDSDKTLAFSIPFKKLLDPVHLTIPDWKAYVSLYFRTETDNDLLYSSHYLNGTKHNYYKSNNNIIYNRRMLFTTREIEIKEITATDQELVFTTQSVPATEFTYTHAFYAKFNDNLYSPSGMMYSIDAEENTDDCPWVVREYLDLNLEPFYLIGIFLAIAGLIILLMRIKYVYRVTIEYMHSIQLLGLAIWCIYPHYYSVNVYSFLIGLDFSNFSFMYNIPKNFI